MRLGLVLAITAGIVCIPIGSPVNAAGAHGPTTIVTRHADGTHTVMTVEARDSYQAFGSELWGGFNKRDLTTRDTQQHLLRQ